jgi:AcrR family transcriptional regulator
MASEFTVGDGDSSARVRGRKDHSARDRILTAAIEVFGSFGFTKSTIQEIASVAHVSKPLFYRHYRNKQEIFEAAVDQVFSEWHKTLVERVDAGAGGAADSIQLLFVGMLEYGRARPFLNRLLTRDSQLLLASQSNAWDRACRALQQFIEQILQTGIEAGEIRRDLPAEHMADLLTEIHFAYANRELLTGNTIDSSFAASLVAGMLSGILKSDPV